VECRIIAASLASCEWPGALRRAAGRPAVHAQGRLGSRTLNESVKVVDDRPAAVPEKMSCLVLAHQAADGPKNMALDEALLETVAAGLGAAFVRTYGWTTPTLSLGYFQNLDQVRADSRFRSAPLVRRLTGGGAIWHHHELTYALVIPSSHPLVRPSTGLYTAAHGAIVEALLELGIPAARRGESRQMVVRDQRRPLLCFTDPDPEDIVTKGVKIVGSAQRRRGGAVLQHGSLLLARSSRTPELLGVSDVAGESAGHHDWADRLVKRIVNALGLEPVAADIPAKVAARAAELEVARYRNPAWIALR
jgi:lipoate-protein ligase A